MKNCSKNSFKFGKKLATLSETNLLVNLYITKKYLKTTIKSHDGKIFTIIKYQRKDLNVFVYQK